MKLISEIAESRCPACMHKLDAAKCIEEKYKEDTLPKKGDITICLYCSTVLVFRVRESKLVPMLMKEQAVNNLPQHQLRLIRKVQRVAQAVRPPYSSRQ